MANQKLFEQREREKTLQRNRDGEIQRYKFSFKFICFLSGNSSDKRKYVHKLLVNRLFKPAQEKVWLGELTVLQ